MVEYRGRLTDSLTYFMMLLLLKKNKILLKIESLTMIRPITSDDNNAVLALAKKLEMFDSDGLKLIKTTLADYLSGNSNDRWFSVDENGLVGVIYCAPEPMTNGTWNVLMLLVDRDRLIQTYSSVMTSYTYNPDLTCIFLNTSGGTVAEQFCDR